MHPLKILIVAVLLSAQICFATEAKKSIHTNIPYEKSEVEDDVRKLDIYEAGTTKKLTPVIIWFHGGGLTSGTKNNETDKKFARFWQAQGVTVVAVDYRLNPSVSFPVYIEDAAQSVAWVVKNAKQYHIDTTKIFIGGHSAGAYLASMLALADPYLKNNGVDPHSIAGFISLSGQMTTHFQVRKERGLSDLPVIVDNAAPAYYVTPNPPRMLLLIGDNDWPARLEENQLLYSHFTKLAKTNNVDFHIIKDRTHNSIYEKISEPDDPAFHIIQAFMKLE